MVTIATGLTFDFGPAAPCAEDGDVDVCTTNNPDNLAGIDPWPEVSVEVGAYKIDAHEVTNVQYEYCVAKGICREPAFDNAVSAAQLDYYGKERFWGYPVVNVSWADARTYCESVGKRLPTEAEWERAAKGDPADGARLFPAEQMGANLVSCKQLALPTQWCAPNGSQDMEPAPARAASGGLTSGSNDYVEEAGQRIYHLFGNAAEWVQDVYDPQVTCADDPPCTPCWECPPGTNTCRDECATCAAACGGLPNSATNTCHYACLGTLTASLICTKHVTGLPLSGDTLGPTVGTARVVRGGSVIDGQGRGCLFRSSARDRAGRSTTLDPTIGDTFIGFRCACSLADCPPE
jgi:formylglycine-generating enzyme required for sulfatase activity